MLFCIFATFFEHLVKSMFLFYSVETIKRNKLRVCKHICLFQFKTITITIAISILYFT